MGVELKFTGLKREKELGGGRQKTIDYGLFKMSLQEGSWRRKKRRRRKAEGNSILEHAEKFGS